MADNTVVIKDLSMSYSYALDKQIEAESFATGGVVQDASFTASYDNGNRLTSWSRPNGVAGNGVQPAQSQTWSFDDAGNWDSTVIDGTTQSRNHSDADQLTSLAGQAVSHDLKGNMTAFEHAGVDYDLSYDLDNRLVTAEVDNDDVQYRYDAFGRRTLRKEGSDETALLWWGNSECAEYEHGAGQSCIQHDIFEHPTRLNAVVARAVDGSKYDIQWFHKNYLDHVYAVSDDNGNLLEYYRYSAYGEAEVYNGSGSKLAATNIDNSITWNTRRQDRLTGFHMYKYRHYASVLGRWPSRDPIEEAGGVNLYGFVGNDAITDYDAFGLIFGIGKGVKCDNIKRLILDAKLTIASYSQDADIDGTLPEDWDQVAHVDEDSGLNYRVFENNQTGERVLAFRGTEGIKGTAAAKDWKANGEQGAGLIGDQYRQVAKLSKNTKLYKSDRVVGHSLGGGLAAAYGAATGKPTTTFNAAGLHPRTSKLFANTNKDYKKHVESVVVRGEVLNMAQDAVPFVLPDSNGRRSYITPDGVHDPVSLHFMKQVLAALEAKKKCCERKGKLK